MRRFFYRCSNETVFYRFFYSVKTMGHDKMQAYVEKRAKTGSLPRHDWLAVMTAKPVKWLF
jgi:hypothetical protein